MTHRHLLPDEIDLLLDGEVGFGVAPLKAHVTDCAECRGRLDEARSVAEALEHLPRFAPQPLFANRVMARVQVFQPWHVAARDTARAAARALVPASPPARAFAAGLAITVAAVLTGVSVWLATRADLLLFFLSGPALEQARVAVLNAVWAAVASVLGEPALAALRASGATGVGIAVLMLLMMIVTVTLGLRALATASSRRRP